MGFVSSGLYRADPLQIVEAEWPDALFSSAPT